MRAFFFFKVLANTQNFSTEQQREMKIEIGVNITAEHPWKQIKKEILFDFLADADTPAIIALKRKLAPLANDELILIGYASFLSEDEDTFLAFEDSDTAREASILIEQLEAFERRRARRSLIKKPRKWKSLGSEKIVDLYAVPKKQDIVDVEIQSVYPINHAYDPFQLRLTKDSRDGYTELVPKKITEIQNVNRKRVDMFVQSAPPRVHLEQQTDPTFPANAWSQYLYEIGKSN